jgi:hypothetical protein
VAFERITVDAGVMGGVPCLRGLRIPGATVGAMVAVGLNRLGRRAAEQVAVIVDNLDAVTTDLTAGAVVVLADDRIRIRRLPFLPGQERQSAGGTGRTSPLG